MTHIPRNNKAETVRAGLQEWAGLVLLMLPCVVVAMDLTVLNLALPAIGADLRPSGGQLLWIIDIYGFLVAGTLITMGALGDRVGRRRLLMIGAAGFAILSFGAAFSGSAPVLILARGLLGLAGATLMPSTLALITTLFRDPGQRTLAIGIWTTSFAAGGIAGPVVGGMLLEHFWWGSVLLAGIPPMILLILFGPFVLPEYRAPSSGRYDVVSAGLSITAILAVIFGVKQLAEYGPGLVALLAIPGGIAVGYAFVRRQLRLADPHIDVRLFRIPRFSTPLALNTLGFFVTYGVLLLVAQYLQSVLGLSPLATGLWLIPFAAGNALGAVATPVLVRRVPAAHVMAGGLVLTAAGCLLLAQAGVASGFGAVLLGSVLVSTGPAPVYVLAVDMIVGAAPPERAGAASAISETSNELGGALGVALIGAFSTFVYRSVFDATAFDGQPAEAVDAARATLGGAMSVAGQLPDEAGARLAGLARSAFVTAVVATAYLSAVLLLAGAFAALRLRRNRPEEPAVSR